MSSESSVRSQNLYSPLPFPDSIRLFRYQRTRSRTAISLELGVFRLRDHPPYRAISYIWGSTADPQQIHINGIPIILRKNLWDALQVFKYHGHLIRMKDTLGGRHHTDWFWADRLCIRQDSTDEKNHQVSQIDQIFRHATCVWAWLGHDRVVQNYIADLQRGRLKGSHECALDAAEYFTRTWIVQECCLANTLILYAGKHAFYNFDSIRNPEFPIMSTIAGGIMTLRRKGIRFATDESLIMFIRMFQYTTCLNPLDKVFALQSMVSTRDRCEVDYNIAPAILFWQVLITNKDAIDYNEITTVAAALDISMQDTSQVLLRDQISTWVWEPSIVLSCPVLPCLNYSKQIWQNMGTDKIVHVEGSPFRLVHGSFIGNVKLIQPPSAPMYPEILAYLVMSPEPDTSFADGSGEYRYTSFGLLWSTQHTPTQERARSFLGQSYLLSLLLSSTRDLEFADQWMLRANERRYFNPDVSKVTLWISPVLFDKVLQGKRGTVGLNESLEADNNFQQRLVQDVMKNIEQNIIDSTSSLDQPAWT